MQRLRSEPVGTIPICPVDSSPVLSESRDVLHAFPKTSTSNHPLALSPLSSLIFLITLALSGRMLILEPDPPGSGPLRKFERIPRGHRVERLTRSLSPMPQISCISRLFASLDSPYFHTSLSISSEHLTSREELKISAPPLRLEESLHLPAIRSPYSIKEKPSRQGELATMQDCSRWSTNIPRSQYASRSGDAGSQRSSAPAPCVSLQSCRRRPSRLGPEG